MKLISFCLFGTENRYWDSLPTCISSHLFAYPDYSLRFHLSKECVNHAGFSFLQKLSEAEKRVEIQITYDSWTGTEPTTWRLKPLWDKEVELFLCRDIDSAPTSEEKRAVEGFTNSQFSIHGIRSYCLHNTDLMAGLCGFKTYNLRKILFCNSFNDYIEFGKKHVPSCKNWEWGCDQHLLRKFFFSGVRGRYCTKIALDSMVGSAKKVSWYRGNYLPEEKYQIDISKYKELFDITDGMFKFLAEPFHFNAEQTSKILNINSEENKKILDCIKENSFFSGKI